MNYRYHLEELVTQRTGELRIANENLKWQIRERERIEQDWMEAYRQIERNIEQFAVLTDHIRNPLQVIQGMADLIETNGRRRSRSRSGRSKRSSDSSTTGGWSLRRCGSTWSGTGEGSPWAGSMITACG